MVRGIEEWTGDFFWEVPIAKQLDRGGPFLYATETNLGEMSEVWEEMVKAQDGIHDEIVAAGFGGQGIMLLGKLISYVAMSEGLHTTFFPSYGAEVRGGTAHCNVVISAEPIASPIIRHPDVAIVMNHPSLDKFEERVRAGGLLIYNSSLTLRRPERADIELLGLPATEIADKLGSIQVANIVMLGAYVRLRGIFTTDAVLGAFKNVLRKHRWDLLEINRLGLESGYEYAARKSEERLVELKSAK